MKIRPAGVRSQEEKIGKIRWVQKFATHVALPVYLDETSNFNQSLVFVRSPCFQLSTHVALQLKKPNPRNKPRASTFKTDDKKVLCALCTKNI